jgi:hypothetical protein
MAQFDPRGLSDDELDALIEGDEVEHSSWFGKTMDNAPGVAEGIGTNMMDMLSTGVVGGLLRTAMLPNDIINLGVGLVSGKTPMYSGQDAVDFAKKNGLVFEKEDPNFMDRFNRGMAESAGPAATGSIVLKSFADMLKARKYIPQTVDAAKRVWQRVLTEAANNPELLKQEFKAGVAAGTALGGVKAVAPNSPWWVDMLAQIGGGWAGSKEKLFSAGTRAPSRMSTEGQEDTVVDVLSELHGSTPDGLDASITEGRMRLDNPDGTPKVPNFNPTTGQVAIRPMLNADGSKSVTRPLNPYVNAKLGGDPALIQKLDEQSRAIAAETEKTLGTGPGVYPGSLEPSGAGSRIRDNLQAARDTRQAEVSALYDQLDENEVNAVHGLFDEGAKITSSRTEADTDSDMPQDVTRFMDTFRDRWPDDAKRNGAPFSFDDFVRLRAEALRTGDQNLMRETESFLVGLNPEKSIGLLKEWRTKAMSAQEDAKGKLRQRIGQFKSGIERAIDSFGDPDPNAPPSRQEARAKFREASAANRDLRMTFDEGPVGAALDKEYGRYRMGESDIPEKFVGSNRQPESWEALVAAAKDPSEATRAARRILTQRFQRETVNRSETPEGEPTVSSSKMTRFLMNPDNRELLMNAYGEGHYNKLIELTKFAKLRESILTSPGVGGSNTKEKLKALEKLEGGKELDRLFASLTLRMGFVARAGRSGTAAVYGHANEVMSNMFRDALIDPGFAKDLLSKARSRAGQRARQRFRLYLNNIPGKAADQLNPESDIVEEEENPGYARGGPVRAEYLDLTELMRADMAAMELGGKWLRH